MIRNLQNPSHPGAIQSRGEPSARKLTKLWILRKARLMGYRAVTTQLIFLLGVLSAVGLLATAQSSLVDEMTTQERLQKNAWWPTKLSRGSEKYVGTAVCASCHAEIAKAQATAEMAQSLQQAGRALPLLTHFGQTISVDGFSYHLTGNADGAGFAVRVGNDTVSKPLVWAFGSGKLSQVYMTPEKDGFNESHFSWFDAVRGFDITPAQPALRVEASSVQGSGDALKRASGRTVAATEIRRCFACHAANVPAEGPIVGFQAGVTCETCHGPGGAHSAAEQAELPQAGALTLNPAHLRPVDQVDFCGACHATSMDVQMSGIPGMPSVRFPAYRLQNSRCWSNDARITCTACHDPHRPLVHDSSSYDRKCLACHLQSAKAMVNADHPGHACPVAQNNCTNCHMPKYEFPDVHHKFTDHEIRIVRQGPPFPP